MRNKVSVEYLQTGVVKCGDTKLRIKKGKQESLDSEAGVFLIGAGYAKAAYIRETAVKTEPEETETGDNAPEEPVEELPTKDPPVKKRRKGEKADGVL